MATFLEAVKRIRNQVIKINKREDRDIKFLGFLKIRRILRVFILAKTSLLISNPNFYQYQ
jgi:hypothetical protein